ncbi:MAG: MBL fold metallo-hydrolase [Ruminococcaceae bacterium]|nr:MBL fold metallo-hydrolase [Oscillospiraceae bacterium]
MKIQKINENIYRFTISYKDIYTTVYTVKFDTGYLVFDAASYDEDIDNYVVPMLTELGITRENLKYVFISHNHRDHAGGLSRLLDFYPGVTVISRSPALAEAFPETKFISPEDMQKIENCFTVVAIPGHTLDSSALYDERTKTLITGDSLQLFGIFGSEDWGANIALPTEHLEAVEKLRGMDIESIYAAHDYHPYGYAYVGREAVENALDAASRPLLTMKKMIENNPDKTDAEIREMYNSSAHIPPVRERVFHAVRELLKTKVGQEK